MKKSRLLLTVLFVAAVVAVIGYAYVVFGNRYFGKKGNTERGTENANQNSIMDGINNYLNGSDNQNQNQNENANSNGNQNNSNANNSNTNSVTGTLNISSSDCDKDCIGYQNPEDKKYCQEICGLAPSQTGSGDCGSLSGKEKDYCVKNLAVSKSDYKMCAQISDMKLKQVCRDRITEDLVQQSGTDL